MDYEEKKRRVSLSHHGLTLENWFELWNFNNGRCWFCGFDPIANGDNRFRSLHIDHDHSCCHDSTKGRGAKSCGKCIRGLLCYSCNLMIGGYENCKGTMPEIAELEKWCRKEYFVFTDPMWAESVKPAGIHSDPNRIRTDTYDPAKRRRQYLNRRMRERGY